MKTLEDHLADETLSAPTNEALRRAAQRIEQAAATSVAPLAQHEAMSTGARSATDQMKEQTLSGANLTEIARALAADQTMGLGDKIAVIRELTPPENGGAWEAASALTDGGGLTNERAAMELHGRWGMDYKDVKDILESECGLSHEDAQRAANLAALGLQYDPGDAQQIAETCNWPSRVGVTDEVLQAAAALGLDMGCWAEKYPAPQTSEIDTAAPKKADLAGPGDAGDLKFGASDPLVPGPEDEGGYEPMD